jgi:hypothetical protein
MRFDLPGFRRDALIRLGMIHLGMIDLGAAFAVCLAGPAAADAVPFACSILPGEEIASIQMTNSLASDASCIVSCRFSTIKYDNNPQITCAKAVPAGKEVEMCRLTSGGDKFVKLVEGNADCLGLSGPE